MLSMRICCSSSSSRALPVALNLHHHLRYLLLSPPAPPIAIGLAQRLFSSSSRRLTKRSAANKESQPPPMDSAAGDPFYVVRKGDVIGIYKSLTDCQAQVSNSVRDPSVTVYKGYSLRKETEQYLAARGLSHALYSINAADARDDLFDDLVPCPFQQPDETATSTLKRSQETVSKDFFFKLSVNVCSVEKVHDVCANISFARTNNHLLKETGPSKKHPKVAEQEPLPDSYLSCILEFDGASKGNPGKAGAGAIIRRLDGSVVCTPTLIAQVREGLGIATSNAAEYRALILGLKYAAKKGFKYIHAQGDSKLVCNQVQDLWRVRNDNMADLCKKVKKLKGMFLSFQISHVLRKFNTKADAQANFAVELPVGEIREQSNFSC